MGTITNAALAADLRLATAIAMEVRRILGDTVDFEQLLFTLNGPGDAGSINGKASAAEQLPYAEVDGQGGMTTASAEDQQATTSDLVTAHEDIAVVRAWKRYDPGDLALITSQGFLNVPKLVALLIQHRRVHINDLCAASIANAGTVVGDTGTTFTLTDFYAAQFAARAGNIPMWAGMFWLALMHHDQVNELTASARAELGPLEHRPDVQNFLAPKTSGFQGFLLNSAIVSTDRIDNDATDHYGGLLGPGALVRKFGIPPLPLQGSGSLAIRPTDAPGLMAEIQRDGTRAVTQVTGNNWYGITKRDERMIGLRSAVP